MMAAWMLHATWIAALLALGARLLDWALTAYRRPARFLWTLVILGSAATTILVPVISRSVASDVVSRGLAPPSSGIDQPGLWASVGTALVSPVERMGLTTERLTALDRPLFLAWMASSLVLLLAFVFSQRRLWRDRNGWGVASFAGTRVRITPDLGPAVIGCWRPEIVIPAWALALDDASKALVARHETEHVCAGDQRLLALGVTSVVLAPWNPFLWWMLQRLRLAIEIDCDRRSIDDGAVLRRYAELLIELGSRPRRAFVQASSLAEGRSMLVRRVMSFTATTPRARFPRAVASIALAGLVVVTAAATRLPPGRIVLPRIDEIRTIRETPQVESAPGSVQPVGGFVRRIVPSSRDDAESVLVARPDGRGASQATFSSDSAARRGGGGGTIIRATAILRPGMRSDSSASTRRR